MHRVQIEARRRAAYAVDSPIASRHQNPTEGGNFVGNSSSGEEGKQTQIAPGPQISMEEADKRLLSAIKSDEDREFVRKLLSFDILDDCAKLAVSSDFDNIRIYLWNLASKMFIFDKFDTQLWWKKINFVVHQLRAYDTSTTLGRICAENVLALGFAAQQVRFDDEHYKARLDIYALQVSLATAMANR